MKKEDKNKIIALLAALIINVAIILFLVFSVMSYEWPPKDMPMPKESEILFGGEYVMLGNVDAPAADQPDDSSPETTATEEPAPAEDMSNAGTPGDPPELISTETESAMKVKKREEKPKKTGPTKEEIAEKERVKREQEKASKINKRVAFGSSGSGSGKEGSPNGNSTTGARSGAPGHSLAGRTLESWGRPSSEVEGVVEISVRVNSKGRVVSATYKGGKGSAAASAEVRNSCKQASLSSRFSVSTESTTEQTGTITWRFE